MMIFIPKFYLTCIPQIVFNGMLTDFQGNTNSRAMDTTDDCQYNLDIAININIF